MKAPPVPMVPVPVAPAKAPDSRTPRMPSEDRRRQLLQVAVDRFARNGFSGTKTKDIAAAAGVSEAILFRHFSSKEDLYHAILDDKEASLGTDRWYEELKEIAARRDDRALFRHIGNQLIRSFREDAAFHRLVLYASLEGHLLADLFHERFGLPMGDFLTQYVTQRQQEGAFRACDPGTAVMFVFGSMVHYAMARFVLGVKNFPTDEESVMDQFVDLTLGGLALSRSEQPPASIRIAKGKQKS